MTKPRIDPERLAAFLDGTVRPAERDQLLGELSAADRDRDRELLADAAAVLRELELAGDLPSAAETRGRVLQEAPEALPPKPPASAEREPLLVLMSPLGQGPTPTRSEPVARVDRAATTTPVEPRPSPPTVRHPWRAVAAAAVILLVVGGSLQRSRSVDEPPSMSPSSLTATVAGGPLAPVSWAGTRGARSADSRRARAVRVGAGLVALELAARARDSAAVRVFARRTIALLGELPGSGPAVQIYRQVEADAGSATSALTPRLREGWEASTGLLDPESMRIGAWLETARAASARSDAGFFRSADSQRVLDTVLLRPDLDATTRDAAQRVRGATRDDAQLAADALQRDVETVLTALGS